MSNIENEIWKQIEKAPNYSVSNFGRVRNDVTCNILKPQHDHKGYHRIRIKPIGTIKVHREVAKAFIANPENKPQVNHKDTNKTNNYFKNLEWMTNLENAIHAGQNGIHVNKWTDVETVKFIKSNPNMSRKKLAELAGVTFHVVKDIRAGKSHAFVK
ncbi:MAG TPA: NUMOD4 domain-containing protein [Nitrososphaeraceae archaeon]